LNTKAELPANFEQAINRYRKTATELGMPPELIDKVVEELRDYKNSLVWEGLRFLEKNYPATAKGTAKRGRRPKH